MTAPDRARLELDEALYGVSFTKGGKRVDPRRVSFLPDLRQRLDDATPGPWRVEGNSVLCERDDAYVLEEVAELASDARLPSDADVLLIVAAVNALPALLGALDEAEKALARIRAVANEQAEDEGLWGIYPVGKQPIVEAYLQQELRRLHEVIEGVTQEQAAREALARIGDAE